MRFKLLKHTRLNVVAFLNELPKTQHDINSFMVDICAQTVSGEGGGKQVICVPPPHPNTYPPTTEALCCPPHPATLSSRIRCCALPSTGSSRKVSFTPLPPTPSPPAPHRRPFSHHLLSLSSKVDGKSRDSVRAFTRMFIAVPAGNTG